MKKHKKHLRLFLIAAVICAGYMGIENNFAKAEEEVPPPSFYDVNKGDTYYVAISSLREWGIIEGYTDGTFKPNISVNRAEALKMITLSTGVFTEEEMEGEEELEENDESDEIEENGENDEIEENDENDEIEENNENDESNENDEHDEIEEREENDELDENDENDENNEIEESDENNEVEMNGEIDETGENSEVEEDNEIEEVEEIEEITETKPFPDTPLGKWYTKYLTAAKELEIIHGHPDGTFRPSNEINLAEALKILFESMMTQQELDLESTKEYLYEDTPPDAWFSIYTSYAGAKGIINIYSNNTVAPAQKMSRGYLAEIMYRSIMSQEGYEFGKATWYGQFFHGRTTASGEIFDKNELTAAHKHLPFNTVVEVTNLANGESVEVRITDRGPYGPGRVIDLSSKAFSEIASLGAGVINVQYEIVHHP